MQTSVWSCPPTTSSSSSLASDDTGNYVFNHRRSASEHNRWFFSNACLVHCVGGTCPLHLSVSCPSATACHRESEPDGRLVLTFVTVVVVVVAVCPAYISSQIYHFTVCCYLWLWTEEKSEEHGNECITTKTTAKVVTVACGWSRTSAASFKPNYETRRCKCFFYRIEPGS